MPSLEHEAVVDLFRNCADLAVELLHRCTQVRLAEAAIEHRSIDLSQAVPTEYRADAVVIVRGANGQPDTGVIVEVQREPDGRKRMS